MVDNSLGDADYYDLQDYVGIGKRLFALVIDSFVLVCVAVAVWMPFMLLGMAGMIQSDPSGVFWIVFLFAVWVYLGPIKRSRFGTLGYRLLGIKLVSAKGGQPSLFNMTIRMMMWMFGPFSFALDLLWLGADTENQSLRDCYLGTYMVARNASPAGRAPLHLTHYTAMGFSLSYPRVCRPNGLA